MSHPKSVLVAAALVCTGAIVLAAPMIDQEQVNTVTTLTLGVGGTSEQKLAQVFKAGLSGKLTHVTLPVECLSSATLRVSIEKTTAGVPDGGVIASEVLPGWLFPAIIPSPAVGFRIVQFNKPAFVAAGIEYAIVLEAFGDTCGVFYGPAGDSYTAGSLYFDARPNPPGWIAQSPVMDMPFQTFVDS